MRWSRRLSLAATAIGLLAGCDPGEAGDGRASGELTGSGPLAVMAAADGSSPARLVRLDARSLAPRSGGVELGEYHDAWSLSPDGARAAFGVSRPGPGSGARVGVRVVDLRSGSIASEARSGIAAVALGWLEPRRLVALLQSGEAVAIDPRNGELLRRESVRPFALQCVPQPAAVTPHGLVLLVAAGARAPARLVVVDASGRPRTATLERVPVGGDCGRGGLAVDAAGRRAFAVGDGPLVADVDLRTLTVSYRPVRGSRFRGFARGSLARLDRGLLAAAGRDASGAPAGVTLIDTRTWAGRTLVAGAGAAEPAGATLLAFDGWGGEPSAPGLGLRAFRSDGEPAFATLRGERIRQVEVVGRRAIADAAGTRYVVDLRSGRTAARQPSRELVDVLSGHGAAGGG